MGFFQLEDLPCVFIEMFGEIAELFLAFGPGWHPR